MTPIDRAAIREVLAARIKGPYWTAQEAEYTIRANAARWLTGLLEALDEAGRREQMQALDYGVMINWRNKAVERADAAEAEITRLMPLAYDTSGMAWRLRAEGHQQAALDALAEVARLQERVRELEENRNHWHRDWATSQDRIAALEAQVAAKDEALQHASNLLSCECVVATCARKAEEVIDAALAPKPAGEGEP